MCINYRKNVFYLLLKVSSLCATSVLFQPVYSMSKSLWMSCAVLKKVCVCVGGCDVDGNRCSVSRNSVCKGRKEGRIELVVGGFGQVSVK